MIGPRLSGALLPSVLVAICAGSSWSIYWSLQPAQEPASIAVAEGGKTRSVVALADDPIIAMPPPAIFAAVVERPLFSADRRLTKTLPQPKVTQPSKVEPAPKPVQPLGLSVKGIVVAGKDSFALVVPLEGGDPVRLAAGDRHAGWTLTEIVSDRVVFRRDARETTLILEFDGTAESRPDRAGFGDGTPPRRRRAEQPATYSPGGIRVRRRGSGDGRQGS